MARAPKVAKVAKAPALFVTTEALSKEMKGIVTAAGKLDDRIQLYLLSEMAHIAQHRNTTRLNEFFAAMKGKGARVTAMSAYVQKFGTVKVDEEKQKFVNADNKSFDLEAAKLVHWTSMKPEQALRSFDLEVQIKRLIQTAVDNASSEERKEAGDKIDMELLNKIIEVTGIKPEAKDTKAKAPKADTASAPSVANAPSNSVGSKEEVPAG